MEPRPHTARTPRFRRLGALSAVTALALGLLVGAGPANPASAAPGTGTGPHGQTLTVSEVDDLDPSGTTVTVTGTGFDIPGFDLDSDGLYLAFCVDNGPGVTPTPCVGGVDLEGESGSSRWVTNNPYEGTPAVPIAADGSFETTITIQAADEWVDCQALPAGQECKVVTRVDHRRGGDRSQDVKVAVGFGDGTTVPDGPALTVEPSIGLDPAGQDLTVRGEGYPTDGPGIYVVYGPQPENNTDATQFGSQAFVPASAIDADGSFATTLPDVQAVYTGENGVDYDFSDGGGFVSTMRAHGVPDPTGLWENSVAIGFAGAARADTTTSLVAPPATATVGRPVTVTAEVATIETAATSGTSRAPVAAGTVEFLDGSTPLGSATLSTSGRATRTVTFAAAGSRTLTARFSGTDVAAPSTSSASAVVVSPDTEEPPPPPPPPPSEEPSGTRTGTGAHGQTLTATPVDNLDPAGTEVELVGRGFTEAAGFDIANQGLYVSFCVDNGAGRQPTPCVGGVDMEGASGSSQWVTNNPYDGVPDSAVTPVASDGSFTTRITVSAADEFVDCLDLPAGQRCVIVARMDHRATADRSQDVKVPVCFAGEAECATDPIDPTGTGDDTEFAGFPLETPSGATGVGGTGSTSSTAAASTPLARTGFDGRWLVATGLAALAAGATIVSIARRRTAAAPVTVPVIGSSPR